MEYDNFKDAIDKLYESNTINIMQLTNNQEAVYSLLDFAQKKPFFRVG